MKSKIEKLTPAQEKRLVEYRNEWLAIGRSAAPSDRPAAEKAISRMYELLGKKRPYFWWCDGPAVGSLVRTILPEIKKEMTGKNLRDNLGDNLSWGFWGSHESAWPAYYNFPDAELRKMFSDEQREKLHLWLSVCAGTGWWEPYENVVFMCERPSVQIVNSGGRLHCETGPAILCRDGWPVYALNGVRMKPEHVLTPAEKLDPTECLKETNADIRRELIRKMGVESMLAHLPHKVLDTQGDYSLLKIDFPGLVQDTRFLKMLNPSIGVWHVEGIERSCNTVEQAINWRAAGAFGETVKWNPAQLT
jgi:hypothetical protein